MVAHPTAMAGTIQGTDGNEVQPNQNKPMGRRMDSTQTKYRRPSADELSHPNRAAIFSCQMLMRVIRTTPTHMARYDWLIYFLHVLNEISVGMAYL